MVNFDGSTEINLSYIVGVAQRLMDNHNLKISEISSALGFDTDTLTDLLFKFHNGRQHQNNNVGNEYKPSSNRYENRRERSTRIRVTLLDGSVVENNHAIHTFMQILEMFDLYKVEQFRMDIDRHKKNPLVRKYDAGEPISRDRKKDSSGQWTIYTTHGSQTKVDILNQIQDGLGKNVFSDITIVKK